MAIKRLRNNPVVADTVLFELKTTDDAGTPKRAPIRKIKILYLQSGFHDKSKMVYEKEYPYKLNGIDLSPIRNSISYVDAIPVYVLGDDKEPIDSLKEGVDGEVELLWSSEGQREGNYFIVWKYGLDGKEVTRHIQFYLGSSPFDKVPVPHHHDISPDKYDTLLDRYLPAAFKSQIMEGDLTPSVIGKVHFAVSRGFTLLESLACQIVDAIDANYAQESFLPLAGAFFDLRLRTKSASSWRRQIKQAMPLFKAKGTLAALREALDQIGVNLNKLTMLWQVSPRYTQIDSFEIGDDENFAFKPSKAMRSLLQIAIRASGQRDYLELPLDFGHVVGGKVVWAGGAKEQPVRLFPGDVVRIKYLRDEIPEGERELERYILSLPLADRRDETLQRYPLKNWNLRVLEEDDPLFDKIIPERQPFFDHVVFGKVRTTFMYSEKIYNMDAYDGSLRDSEEPCDIDKDFLDGCAACQSSSFRLDLEVKDLSEDRLREIRDIVEEFSPFHAILHSISVKASLREFMLPREESLSREARRRPRTDSIVIKDSVRFKVQRKNG